MIKALLIDADGVALRKSEYFSERFSREYNIPIEEILSFSKYEFRKCQLGQADLKEVLQTYLEKWQWAGSVDDFLKYWFESNTKLNEEVMSKIVELRSAGTKCYLVTDQEKYRADYLTEQLNFQSKFDRCFYSYILGCSKSDAIFFQRVLEAVNEPAAEILYLDDESENLTAANSLGIRTKLYTALSDLTVE
jgi:putative hydrolase of the HAD superfamily